MTGFIAGSADDMGIILRRSIKLYPDMLALTADRWEVATIAHDMEGTLTVDPDPHGETLTNGRAVSDRGRLHTALLGPTPTAGEELEGQDPRACCTLS